MMWRESLRKLFWSILGAIGIVAFWAGVWDGIGYLPFLENAWISLAVGMIMLAGSGLLFKEFDPWKDMEQSVATVMHRVNSHPEKHQFHIKYHDQIKKGEIIFRADTLKNVEKSVLVFIHKNGKEVFIPLHRVTEVMHKGKTYWKGYK